MFVLLSLNAAVFVALKFRSTDNFKIHFSVAVNTVFSAVSLKFTDIVLLVIPPRIFYATSHIVFLLLIIHNHSHPAAT